MHRLRPSLCFTLLLALAVAAPARAQSEPDSDPSVDALASQLKGGSRTSGVQLSGFADFSYEKFFLKAGSLYALDVPRRGAFSVGNLNLYLDAPLAERVRSFIEIRYSYLPNGTESTSPDASLSYPRQGTEGFDYANGHGTVSWGGIVIERAFVEYMVDDRLTVRAGHFLTPYGVWNVDHGSPAILGIIRPYIVSQELIPNHQVGLDVYGRFHVGDSRLGYHATMSNGRILKTAQYLDYDDRFSFGGRLLLENDRLANLKLGFSAYGGRYTNSETALDLSTGVPRSTEKVLDQWDELSLAGDLRFDVAGIGFTGEVAWNDRRYRANKPARPDTSTFDHDSRWGGYVTLDYPLPFLRQVTPYVRFDFYRESTVLHDLSRPDLYIYAAGVNTHLRPNVVVKVEYVDTRFRGVSAPPYGDPLRAIGVQTAWAF